MGKSQYYTENCALENQGGLQGGWLHAVDLYCNLADSPGLIDLLFFPPRRWAIKAVLPISTTSLWYLSPTLPQTGGTVCLGCHPRKHAAVSVWGSVKKGGSSWLRRCSWAGSSTVLNRPDNSSWWSGFRLQSKRAGGSGDMAGAPHVLEWKLVARQM